MKRAFRVLFYKPCTFDNYPYFFIFFYLQMKTRSKESLTKLGDVLSKLKPSHFQDAELAAYKVYTYNLQRNINRQTFFFLTH